MYAIRSYYDGFGDVEETGILIAVDEILEEKRMRHIQSFIEKDPNGCKLTSRITSYNVCYTKLLRWFW